MKWTLVLKSPSRASIGTHTVYRETGQSACRNHSRATIAPKRLFDLDFFCYRLLIAFAGTRDEIIRFSSSLRRRFKCDCRGNIYSLQVVLKTISPALKADHSNIHLEGNVNCSRKRCHPASVTEPLGLMPYGYCLAPLLNMEREK